MPKSSRVSRPNGELGKELRDQLALMQESCKLHDNGTRAAYKYIALNLRVLLHHHGRNSQALLQQLGIRNIRFLDTAGEFDPRNLLTTANLVSMRLNVGGTSGFVSAAEDGYEKPTHRLIPFATWWNMPVFIDKQKRTFNRRELVTHVADTDGGAHVDPELEEAYMDLSRKNSLNWTMGANGVEIPLNDPVPPSIRQIGFEVLSTLSRRYPEFFDGTPYLLGPKKS